MFELLFTHPSWAYRTGAFAFASDWPRSWLAALILCAVVFIAASLHRRRELGARKLLVLGVLQTSALALALALLWRPVLNVERARERENVLALALDASSSMAYGEDGRTRLEEATAALRAGPLAQMKETFEVRLFEFSQSALPVESFEEPPPPGQQTRIGDALLQVLQSLSGAPLAGVVLVSDGAENGGTLTEERLAQIASYGVPVHTVGVGPERIEDDLELERVELAASAPQGAKISAQLTLRHGREATTRLRVYDGDTLIATRPLALPSKPGRMTLAIDLPAAQAGAHRLRFTLDALEGERNTINNTRTRVVNVPVGSRNILYVEGEPRWEYKFLRRAAQSDRALRIASLVRTTPNKHYRQGVNSPAELSRGFPETAEALFAYDAIIIGSYEAASLRGAQHLLLKDFVDRRGGSLLMLAGRYGLSAGGWQNVAIAQALPVQLPARQAGAFVQRKAQAAPTVYGAQSAIARLEDDPVRNAERWQTLPALADFQALGRLKPGAVVLLDAVSGRERAPLLIWQRFGRGATYVLGAASTLRWQMMLPPEDQRHETFWRQLLHALADAAPARATLTSEREVYDDERIVKLEAELHDERFEPISEANVELRIAPEIGPAIVQAMAPSGRGDGRYAATIDAAATGVYRIDMTAKLAGEPVGEALAHVTRNDGVAEHFAFYQHRDALERIAAMTGARYWPLADLSGLAAAIPYSKAGVVERQILDLWNAPIVFIVLIGLKLVEWLLRLRWGRL